MSRRRFIFESPDRFIAGTVGEPGNRTFFLQAREGGRLASVSIEKTQVAALAQRLTELLDELAKRGVEGAEDLENLALAPSILDEPVIEYFRVGTLALGWETTEGVVLIEAREISEDDDEDDAFEDNDEDGPDILRVRISAADAREFVARSLRLIVAGRPPCPLCHEPLDPQGHLCPRRNGHRLN
jgi:uncharacterized repeat protein (TIGR03847 family)